MKILIINSFGSSKLVDSEAVPRINDKVCAFYTPHPTVKNVLWYPDEEIMDKLCITEKIDAIVTVE